MGYLSVCHSAHSASFSTSFLRLSLHWKSCSSRYWVRQGRAGSNTLAEACPVELKLTEPGWSIARGQQAAHREGLYLHCSCAASCPWGVPEQAPRDLALLEPQSEHGSNGHHKNQPKMNLCGGDVYMKKLGALGPSKQVNHVGGLIPICLSWHFPLHRNEFLHFKLPTAQT